MVYRGRVKNGVVVLEGPARLEEGAEVSVRPIRRAVRSPRRKKQAPTLYERLKPFIGKVKGLHIFIDKFDLDIFGQGRGKYDRPMRRQVKLRLPFKLFPFGVDEFEFHMSSNCYFTFGSSRSRVEHFISL